MPPAASTAGMPLAPSPIVMVRRSVCCAAGGGPVPVWRYTPAPPSRLNATFPFVPAWAGHRRARQCRARSVSGRVPGGPQRRRARSARLIRAGCVQQQQQREVRNQRVRWHGRTTRCCARWSEKRTALRCCPLPVCDTAAPLWRRTLGPMDLPPCALLRTSHHVSAGRSPPPALAQFCGRGRSCQTGGAALGHGARHALQTDGQCGGGIRRSLLPSSRSRVRCLHACADAFHSTTRRHGAWAGRMKETWLVCGRYRLRAIVAGLPPCLSTPISVRPSRPYSLGFVRQPPRTWEAGTPFEVSCR